MFRTLIIQGIVFLACADVISAQVFTRCDEQSIINSILENYDRNVRPDPDEVMTVKHRVELLGISAATDQESLTRNYIRLNIWEDVFWTDSRLSWSTRRCDIKEVRVQKDDVWLPQVFNYFAVKPTTDKADGSLVSIRSNGETGYTAFREIDSACDLQNIVANGLADCTISFGSWNYPMNEMVFEVATEDGGFGFEYFKDTFEVLFPIVSSSTLVNRKFASYPVPFVSIDYTLKFLYKG